VLVIRRLVFTCRRMWSRVYTCILRTVSENCCSKYYLYHRLYWYLRKREKYMRHISLRSKVMIIGLFIGSKCTNRQITYEKYFDLYWYYQNWLHLYFLVLVSIRLNWEETRLRSNVHFSLIILFCTRYNISTKVNHEK